MINEVSQYPEQINPMLFFQDNSLDKIDIINTYNSLIIQKKYYEANEFIRQQENIHGYFAHCFNAIENRIDALQEYLLTKRPLKMFIHLNIEPTQVNENIIWIE